MLSLMWPIFCCIVMLIADPFPLGAAAEKRFDFATKKQGVLEFDFVPSTRPPADDEISNMLGAEEHERITRKARRLRKDTPQLLRWFRCNPVPACLKSRSSPGYAMGCLDLKSLCASSHGRWELSQVYLKAAQAQALLEPVESDSLKVEFIMVMWNRIVDEENIRDCIIEKLDDEVVAPPLV